MSLNHSAEPVSSHGRPASVSWSDEVQEAAADATAAATNTKKTKGKKGKKSAAGNQEEQKHALKSEVKERDTTDSAVSAAPEAESPPAPAESEAATSSPEPVPNEVQPVTVAEQQVLDAPEPASPFSQGLSLVDVQSAEPAAAVSSSSSVAPAASSSSSPATTASGHYRATPYTGIPLNQSPSFVAFRASVPKLRVMVGSRQWTYFDLGPRDPSVAPLVCIPGTSGNAEMFFYQMMELGNKGYRVISVSPPAYFTHDDWCNGFNGFLHALGLTRTSSASPAAASPSSPSSPARTVGGQVHVFANSLAGYLCLYYLSHIIPARNFIASLVLCNSFCDTTMYQRQNGNGGFCMSLLKHAPGFVLRKYVLDSLPDNTAYPEAVDFMIEQLDEMPREVLASRLILNILKSRGVAQPDLWKNKDGTPFSQQNVTIMDTTDESVLPEAVRNRLYDILPNARYALLKHGGDLPFLSVADEVNMHLQLHLRQFGVAPSTTAPPTTARTSSNAHGSSSAGVSHPVGSPSSFLSLSVSHAALGKTKKAALGYGHDDDDDGNDSIFLTTKPSASPNTAPGHLHAAASAGESTVSLARPNHLAADEQERAERAAIMAAIQAEANAAAPVTAASEPTAVAVTSAEEASRREQSEAADREAALLAVQREREAREAALMASLLDDPETDNKKLATDDLF